MKIGGFKHRILFQREIKTDDSAHGHTKSWNDVVEVWAKVRPLSGREVFFTHQLKNTITHLINVRYRDDIDTELRIKFGTRIMKIESMINLNERGKFLEIRCEEEM